MSLLQRAMQHLEQPLCLIDGFPRNADNVEAWTKHATEPFEFALDLVAPEDVLRKRLLSRQANRSDDDAAVIAKRFAVRLSLLVGST